MKKAFIIFMAFCTLCASAGCSSKTAELEERERELEEREAALQQREQEAMIKDIIARSAANSHERASQAPQEEAPDEDIVSPDAGTSYERTREEEPDEDIPTPGSIGTLKLLTGLDIEISDEERHGRVLRGEPR